MKHSRSFIGTACALTLLVGAATAQSNPSPGRLSVDGVLRASATVDSVFVDRTAATGSIDGGDWASYLLARLGAGEIPDSLGIEVVIDSTRIVVRGRLQDLPAETRALLGPLAAMVDAGTVIAADVAMQRTGPQVVRFWLRGLSLNGIPFPEFVLASMMASVGRQYPALTKTGRDLYVQVPADAVLRLDTGVVRIAIDPEARPDSPKPPRG